ncbi:MAG: glycine dehydrogenase, partial [Candidatus Binatia bacterium]
MRYIPHTEDDVREMLAAIGAATVEDLVAHVPAELRRRAALDIAPGLVCFAGGGAYPHFSPSVVDAIIQRSEFATAYTPYQPEVSQGTLQASFEFQSLICNLTGMEVTNASVYDGASAVAEAVLMALRLTGRERVVVSGAVNPRYRDTLSTYV